MRSGVKTDIFQWITVMLFAVFVASTGTTAENALEKGASGSSFVISHIRITISGKQDKADGLASLARDMIVLKEGEAFTEKGLADSITALKESHLFQAIDVPDPDWNSPAPVLTFVLTPSYWIKDIRIQGAFPLLEEKVLSTMNIACGDTFSPVKLKDQEARLKALYQREGYPDPQITATADLGSPEQGVIVNILIDKGSFYGIRKFTIIGNESFWGLRLKMRTHFYKASFLFGESRRLVQAKLDQDIRNLTKFYRERGYPDVKIQVKTDIQETIKKANVQINIDEGPYYRIRFEGNTAFWGSTLKKDLDISGRGNTGDITLKRGIRNIKERYRKAGFPDAWLTMNSQTAKENDQVVRTVTIHIDEGQQYVVDSLEISGNKGIQADELKKQILLQKPGILNQGAFVQETLDEDIAAVTSMYRNSGYANVSVKSVHSWHQDPDRKIRRVKVVISVDEGPLFHVGTVTFAGLTAIEGPKALDLIASKQAGTFSEAKMQDDEKKLSEAVSELGYPHVTVSGNSVVQPGKDTVDICYTVNEGTRVTKGKTVFLGNFVTRDSILENELEQKEGDPFSLLKYLETQRNLRNVNALKNVEFKEFGLRENAGRVDLEVQTEEKKTYYVESALGYDNSQKKYLTLKVGDRNLFGLNKEAWASYHLSEIGYRTEVGITEPRFLGTRISSTLDIYTERLAELNLDYGTRTNGASLTLNRDYRNKYSTALNFQYSFKDLYRRNDNPISQEELDTYDGRHVFVTTPSVTYNSTDSFIRPTQGIYANASVDFSNALGDEADDFLRYKANFSTYYSPWSFLTLALRGKYGFLDPIARVPAIPKDQLFYLGGVTSVRGFDENLLRYDSLGEALGGREMIMGSLEARIYIGYNLEITVFTDSGELRKSAEGVGENGFRTTAGTGLRYITPIGPVGFLYGRKLSPNDNESKGKWNFTVGYTF